MRYTVLMGAQNIILDIESTIYVFNIFKGIEHFQTVLVYSTYPEPIPEELSGIEPCLNVAGDGRGE